MNITDESNPYFLTSPPAMHPRPILPPDGNLELHLELSEVIQQEGCHHVYRVIPRTSHESSQAFTYPPMVIKVSAESKFDGQSLAEEAAMYDHLMSLQGSVIPRCYGYFTRPFMLFGNVGLTHNASLSILLLEFVGRPVSDYYGLGQDLREDLYGMYNELCELGIYHRDLRPKNVLWVDERLEGLPSLASPRSGRVYGFRIIDLESVVQTNMSTSHSGLRWNICHLSTKSIIKLLQYGCFTTSQCAKPVLLLASPRQLKFAATHFIA
ncbi:uncharacterized protein B0H18DRAFT_1187967 [Fomitopsis serialis]|uniref:uncharacterized protein n=1 Tax=Fomitopsis serialis TaxID=139415 RepID=UPI0020078C4E|nr:uncharacterized protein B0H18DRAFT_1187967 [Neoantrodia serialis]KAH9934235.1 hypothetical protein B0H18DRAFT_1187967 [Neoantrodia serialis]